MKCPSGRPVVVITVRAQFAPVLSKRQTALGVVAKRRVPLANSIEVTELPSSRSCAAFGPPTYGFVFVGSVVQVVPQSGVSHTRFVPNAASVGATPDGETAIGA